MELDQSYQILIRYVTRNQNDAVNNLRIASASENCLRYFPVIILDVLICLKSVFSDGQDLDITPHQHFLWLFVMLQTVTKRQQEYTENVDKQREREWKIQSSTTQSVSVWLLIETSTYVPEIQGVLTWNISSILQAWFQKTFSFRIHQNCPSLFRLKWVRTKKNRGKILLISPLFLGKEKC